MRFLIDEDLPHYPPNKYAGIVILSIPRDATASFILNLFESLLKQEELIPQLSGKLIIVEAGRIRSR